MIQDLSETAPQKLTRIPRIGQAHLLRLIAVVMPLEQRQIDASRIDHVDVNRGRMNAVALAQFVHEAHVVLDVVRIDDERRRRLVIVVFVDDDDDGLAT